MLSQFGVDLVLILLIMIGPFFVNVTDLDLSSDLDLERGGGDFHKTL